MRKVLFLLSGLTLFVIGCNGDDSRRPFKDKVDEHPPVPPREQGPMNVESMKSPYGSTLDHGKKHHSVAPGHPHYGESSQAQHHHKAYKHKKHHKHKHKKHHQKRAVHTRKKVGVKGQVFHIRGDFDCRFAAKDRFTCSFVGKKAKKKA